MTDDEKVPPLAKEVTTRAFLLCLWGTLLVFLMVMTGLACGHDGMVLVSAVAAISGMVAAVSGYTIGRVLPPRR